MTNIISSFAKVSAVIFSGVVAPIVVDVTLRDIRGEAAAAGKERAPSHRTVSPGGRDTPVPPPAPAAQKMLEVTEVIAQGVGATPTEALQDALRTALHQALAARVDALTWARTGSALYEQVARHGGEVIHGWKELETSKQWRLRGTLHHCAVAVEINRHALAERLHAAQQGRAPAVVVQLPALQIREQ
jgi:hypothetical protein